MADIDGIAYTAGPGLAGALLVGASVAEALAYALDVPALPIHHLEGHLLSPLLSQDPPRFPFVALLVSGGHTQLMRVAGVGAYELLGESVDDAAGEAFDKTAKLLGLGYPGGPRWRDWPRGGRPGASSCRGRCSHSGDLDFSFSGLKTAVLTAVRGRTLTRRGARRSRRRVPGGGRRTCWWRKSPGALQHCGLDQLVVAGGVGANRRLRRAARCARPARAGFRVFYPELELCTDNGAMIAFAGAQRLPAGPAGAGAGAFAVRPRWPLANLVQPTAGLPERSSSGRSGVSRAGRAGAGCSPRWRSTSSGRHDGRRGDVSRRRRST